MDDAVAAVEGEAPWIDERTEPWLAVRGYREAMTYILQLSTDAHFAHHEAMLRSLHSMMLSYDLGKHPGRWPIVVRAALAHLNLVMIHPFSDGNGRMARALQTLVLARDPLPWIKFCLTAHYRQAETLLRRSQEAGRLSAELEAAIQGRALQERVILALHDAAFGFRVRNTTYRKAAEVSDAVASRDLGQLVAAGLLEAHGEKRGRYYAAGEFLQRLRADTRLTTIKSDPFTGDQVREERVPYRAREAA